MLEKANEYIRQNYIDEKEKPLFHVTPEAGWMNDPNGFSVYQGKVHLFYQFYPYKTEWGPMHWGHQVTEDLLKWEAYPVAMAPDQDYDHIGCFSGSAVEADGKHVLLYTGVSQKDGKEIQNQCIAIGDGKTYEKWQDNPVIKGDIMPEKFDRKDFRDPKIWKKNGRYYCVVGNRYEENCGQIVLFSSADYKNWRYEKVLLRNDGKNGDMLECPDYLEVDGYPVIICSPQNMHAQKYEFHNGHNSIYIIGDAEKEISDFAWEKKRSLDYGLDFYAPQTTELPDGRRIMVAWGPFAAPHAGAGTDELPIADFHRAVHGGGAEHGQKIWRNGRDLRPGAIRADSHGSAGYRDEVLPNHHVRFHRPGRRVHTGGRI